MNNEEKRMSGIKIMARLIKILKPLTPIMMITITFGVLGFLAATAVTTFGAVAIGELLGIDMGFDLNSIIKIIIGCAILRGVLRSVEQYSGHYIAFRILAILSFNYKKTNKKLDFSIDGYFLQWYFICVLRKT